MSAKEALHHPWLAGDGQKDQKQFKALKNVTQNLMEFSKASSFQKMILSILSSLKVQQDELSELKYLFQSIDTNFDGTLTSDELLSGLEQLNKFEMLKSNNFDDAPQDNIKKIMDRCDIDGDGKIDYLEFVQAAIDHKALINKDNIDAIFNMLDSNGDGEIDMKELKENFRGSGPEESGNEAIFEQIIKEVDQNNDGLISVEEFNIGMKKMLINTFKQVK